MNSKQSLFKSKRFIGNVVFIGEKPTKNKIQINALPGFFDAVKLAEQQSSSTVNSPYQFIPLGHSTDVKYNFYELHLSKTIRFVFSGRSLQLIGSGFNFTKEEVYHVFKHFLVKKGNRVLFLTEAPKDKVHIKQKKSIKVHNEMKGL